ncbi:universal stress protein [Streptomyces lasiicapitis]|uniref:Universal stress protein n=1 Tax=Streptomyces lasiicapitis TaxID=1923961 RepID=A0ABQ2LPK8_9ACTN|nr:universal stress protein [Streptomyces lasiicapitis]GGO41474.1 universal stress protein [Streptomyces lasiicapitis]
MDGTLIVGVDGSQAALRALDWAADEAVRGGFPLRIVHASGWEWYEGHEPSFGINRDAVRAQADRVLEEAADRVRARTGSVVVASEVLDEDPAAALIGESRRAAGVIVGSRGRGRLAGLLLGSVSLSVAAHAPCPVTVVRGGEQNLRGGFGRVVVGVDEAAGDGAAGSGAAVGFAVRAARWRGAELLAVHAWRRRAGTPTSTSGSTSTSTSAPADTSASAPASGSEPAADPRRLRAEHELDNALHAAVRAHGAVDVRREAVEGQARAALLDASATADLLVVGARRRAGHTGLQLGPVNHAVLHHAACPVTVVPHA